MKQIAISGSSGIDIQVKISSVSSLDPPFRKFLRKTVAYSKISEYYGVGWDIERVLKVLKNQSIAPFYYSYGGRAPHVAYGIARLGGNVRLITIFGDDFDEPYEGLFDGGYWSHLVRSGVKMNLLKVEVPDQAWQDPKKLKEHLEMEYKPDIYRSDALLVSGKKTPTIICCKDLKGIDFFYIDDISGAGYIEVARPVPIEVIKEVDSVFVTTSEMPFMRDMVKTASKLEKEVLMDIGSYGITSEYLRETVPLSDIIFGNESEIRQVCEAFGAKSIEEIFDLTGTNLPKAIVLEDKFNGVGTIFSRGERIKVGPVPINKIGNSVGCCDGIAAGFLFLYQQGFDLEMCVRGGLVLCSTIWEVEGVQEGFPDKEEFYRRFVAYWGSECTSQEITRLRQVLFEISAEE